MAPGQVTGVVAKSPAPKSKASLAMIQVDQSLVNMNGVIVDIKTPISALVIDLHALSNQFINPGLNFCDDILKLCDSLDKALQLCNFLTPFPTIGQLVGSVKKVIEKMQIGPTVRKVVGDVKATFVKARDTTMKPIVNASNKILGALQTLSDKLQPCRQALSTITNLFDLIDLSVYVLFDNKPNNKSITDSFLPLEQMAATIGQRINTIQSSLMSLKTFSTGDAFKNFKNAIAGPLSNELGPLQQRVRELQSKMGPLVDAMIQATDKLGPLKWVLNRFNWLINKTINPVVQFIINRTPLKGLVDEIGKKIEDALGVNVLKDKVNKALGTSLQNLQVVVTSLQTQAELSVPLVDAFTKDLHKFRELPGTKLLEIVSKGLQFKYPQLFDQSTNQTTPIAVNTLMARVVVEPMEQAATPLQVDFDQHDVEHIDDYKDLELDIIEVQQLLMARFVDNVEHELEDLARLQGISIPRSTGSTEALPAPKLAYAFCKGEAVSVLMRVDHDPVLEQQAQGRDDPLAPMSGTLLSNLTVADPLAEFSEAGGKILSKQIERPVVSPTGGKVPNLDKFTAKCDDLKTVIDQTKAKLDQIKTAAKQADTLFAKFAPDADQFGNHLVNMLAQLDPIFLESAKMLKLPTKYRTALTNNLLNMLSGSGAAAATTQITDMFNVIDKANAAINDVGKHVAKVSEQSKTASMTYKAVFVQSSQVVALSRFQKTLGPSVTNLTTFVEALQTRLDQATGSLGSLATAAVAVTQTPDQLVNEISTYTKFNDLFGQLLPFIEPMIIQAKKVPPLVETLYTALNSAFSDMQTLFTATQTIVLICRKAEAQVINADVFRGLCTRINSAVAPFEGFLAQLQAQAVNQPLSTGIKFQVAAAPVPVGGTTPGPPPKKATPLTNPSPKSATLAVKTANTALGGAPFDIVTSLIGPKIFEAINAKLATFANINELDTQLAKLNALNPSTAKTNFVNFNEAITSLVTALEPKAVAAANINSTAINPLLDQAKAQKLVAAMQSIETAMVGAIKPAVGT